jgi:hypothetical protein
LPSNIGIVHCLWSLLLSFINCFYSQKKRFQFAIPVRTTWPVYYHLGRAQIHPQHKHHNPHHHLFHPLLEKMKNCTAP